MQVKPRFEKYRFLEKHFITKDDTGNMMYLTLIESNEPEKEEITFYRIIGHKQEKWSNGAISYSENAYWKSCKKELLKININNMIIEEYISGNHHMFNDIPLNPPHIRTSFKII